MSWGKTFVDTFCRNIFQSSLCSGLHNLFATCTKGAFEKLCSLQFLFSIIYKSIYVKILCLGRCELFLIYYNGHFNLHIGNCFWNELLVFLCIFFICYLPFHFIVPAFNWLSHKILASRSFDRDVFNKGGSQNIFI